MMNRRKFIRVVSVSATVNVGEGHLDPRHPTGFSTSLYHGTLQG